MSSPYLDKEPRSELQARAEGHYAGKVSLDGEFVLASTGCRILEGYPGGPSASRANAAYAYLAWTSHEALVNALLNVKGLIDTPVARLHYKGSEFYAETVKSIDAALSLASGKGKTVTANVVFTTSAFDAALAPEKKP